MSIVLDASAWLAYLLDEPAASAVEDLVVDGAVMSAVNLAEVCSRLADVRRDVATVLERAAAALSRSEEPRFVTSGLPVLPETVEVMAFTEADAWTVGALRLATRDSGLSLGDRACLALARRLDTSVVTTNKAWLDLDAVATGVDVIVVPL
ncbi:MAG TPA: type II toxin-antitoxin system VapC family toxin [Acidimicrobiales bacterium]|nr:type II toxin-antitoxin system VapC family toxin [Acidimicrobiales bacterium]